MLTNEVKASAKIIAIWSVASFAEKRCGIGAV